VSTPVYRKLLAGLLDALGPEWQRGSANLIYRTDKNYLLQCITCQSSNFSPDYVPATYIHVLARRGEHLRFDFGGRLMTPRTGFLILKQPRELWLDGSADPPVDEVFRLATEQTSVPFDTPLTIEALAAHIDGVKRSSFAFDHWWSAGIVYGLCGRPVDARKCLDRARKLLDKQQLTLDSEGNPQWEWLSEAIADIAHANGLLDYQVQFSEWCRSIAASSALKLGLKAYG
jgi:hypothetical protein